jgi:hypothetical protein
MIGHTKSYAGKSAEAAHKEALADVREYIGEERHATLLKYIAEGGDEKAVRFGLEIMCGVRGFPVEAFVKEYVK